MFLFGAIGSDFNLIYRIQAVADFPATIFCSELLQIYPHAKIILLLREKQAWLNSMQSTLVHSHTDPDANKLSRMRPLAESYHTYCWNNNFTQNGGTFYDSYLETL